jgi:hypothetical protein
LEAILAYSLEEIRIKIWDVKRNDLPPFPADFNIGSRDGKKKAIVVWRGKQPGVYGF